ncbi:MAG: hypothetical protein PHW82_02850 [Bacteroidales bacterium]|nr:hypothetical protein [Bacteroidales bacterium]
MSDTQKSKNNIIRFLKKNLRNRNILVFLVFFIIAAFLWFLNAINKEYTTDLSLPYKIENLPQNMSLAEDTDDELLINLSGHGYNLLREEIERIKLPLIIDIKSKKSPIKIYNNPNNSTQSFILTKDLYKRVKKRFGDNIHLVKISPDTLFLSVTQTYSKKLKVTPKITYAIEKDYIINGDIVTKPDSITVYGDKSIIDTLNAIYTESTQLGTIGKYKIHQLNIKPINNIRYSKTRVLIDIPLEKYTETYLRIPVQAINCPDNLKIRLLPSTVDVSFKVPLSIYEEITINDFTAIVDFNDIQNQEAEVKVNCAKPELIITAVSPISVKTLPTQTENTND